MNRQSLDDIHGATLVCRIAVEMDRAGNCRVDGSITDREFALLMLDTARQAVLSYHDKGGKIIVPAHDTALVGTDAEKKLLAARHELSDAMAGQ
jgi:hypothetical protein